jgi:hypothetical protein
MIFRLAIFAGVVLFALELIDCWRDRRAARRESKQEEAQDG